MKLTKKMVLEIAQHEALIRQAYKDSVDVWTWSVGLTSATGHDVTRYIDKPQTLLHCMNVFVWALEKYADDVRDVFKGYALTEAEFTGVLSWHWNTGAVRSATWVGLWKSGNKVGARKSFMSWKHPSSIVERRTKEANLLFRGEWSNSSNTMPEYTKLTKRHTPVWSSRTNTDVGAALDIAMRGSKSIPTATLPLVASRKSLWVWLVNLFKKGV